MSCPADCAEMQKYSVKEDAMKSIKVLAAATAMFAMAGLMTSADAQQQAPQDQGGAQGYGYMMGPWMMGPNGMMGNRGMDPWMMGNGQGSYMCTMMTSHIEGRLAYLKTELKITDAQDSLWNAYASAARGNAQAMTTHCRAMMGQRGATGISLPDRLDQHEQFMAAQLDAMRTMNKALKPLYAALSDSQKQSANQLLWGPMSMMW
jgi:hypothetical protein